MIILDNEVRAVWKDGISCPLLTRISKHLVQYWHRVTEGIILINDINKQCSYGDSIGSGVPVTHCQRCVPFCIPEEPGCVLSQSKADLVNQPRVACGNYWPDLTTTLFLWCHEACSAVVPLRSSICALHRYSTTGALLPHIGVCWSVKLGHAKLHLLDMALWFEPHEYAMICAAVSWIERKRHPSYESS